MLSSGGALARDQDLEATVRLRSGSSAWYTMPIAAPRDLAGPCTSRTGPSASPGTAALSGARNNDSSLFAAALAFTALQPAAGGARATRPARQVDRGPPRLLPLARGHLHVARPNRAYWSGGAEGAQAAAAAAGGLATRRPSKGFRPLEGIVLASCTTRGLALHAAGGTGTGRHWPAMPVRHRTWSTSASCPAGPAAHGMRPCTWRRRPGKLRPWLRPAGSLLHRPRGARRGCQLDAPNPRPTR